jgi:hypothetical protein
MHEDSGDRRSSADTGGTEAGADRARCMLELIQAEMRLPRTRRSLERQASICWCWIWHFPAATASICSRTCAVTGPTSRCWCCRRSTTGPPSKLALDLGAMGFIDRQRAHPDRRVASGSVRRRRRAGRMFRQRQRRIPAVNRVPVTGARPDAATGRRAQAPCAGQTEQAHLPGLSLSEATIKVHVSAILRALKVNNRTQVVIELARRGVRLDATAVRAR